MDNKDFISVGKALEKFKDVASITKGAGFTISYGSGTWRINMPGQWVKPEGHEYPITRVFKDRSLSIILQDATKYILDNRVEIPPVKKEYSLLR